MSKPGLSFGLNVAKKSGPGKPAPPKRKPMFGGEDDSDSDGANNPKKETQKKAITELDDEFSTSLPSRDRPSGKSSRKPGLNNSAPPTQPPSRQNKKPQLSVYGDLSSALESRKHQEAAEELDPSIYDYDGVYDTLKQASAKASATAAEDKDRRPKYMKALLASAEVRKRDALIAEEKKIAREREEEGDEFADKEKFVTEAYKKQQAENRKLEAEEAEREAREASENKGGGMTTFYKGLLDRGDRQHAAAVQAAAEKAAGVATGSKDDEEEADETLEDEEKARAERARQMNEKGGAIAINDDGQVVDKREMLKGGLNLAAQPKKKKSEAEIRREEDRARRQREEREERERQQQQQQRFVGAGGGKRAMRERQTRMMEAQLEQSLKRSLEEEEEEKQKAEQANKSRKTASDVSDAKARYLARKREAEEAKKNGGS